MLSSPDFVVAMGTPVIGPVEWPVGGLRALHVPMDSDATMPNAVSVLRGLGSCRAHRPNVSAWPDRAAWLSTAAASLRMRTVIPLAAKADLSPISSVAPAKGVDATGYRSMDI